MTSRTKPIFPFVLIITLVFSFILLFVQCIAGQRDSDISADRVEIPGEEKFVASDEVVIPWRDSGSGCEAGSAHPTPNCLILPNKVASSADILSLYNPDGTLWYRFSLSSKSSDYFYTNTEISFKPFSLIGAFEKYPDGIVLRMIGESEHWYEVEVNEKNRATKFILKSDPMWSKASWGFVFSWSRNVKIDQDQVKLRDKPNGEVIKETADAHFGSFEFEKLDGDWMYVGGIGDIKLPYKRYYGWIRWRNGREILVGSVLNRYKIPETTSVETRNQ
jgi:hypothetical protein